MENIGSHGHLQRLMQLENCATGVSATRALLRQNAEQAHRDINRVITAQIALIRAREQQLLAELNRIHRGKEANLNEQQQKIFRNIGACQQSIELMKNDPEAPLKSLALLCPLELKDIEDVRIEFEADLLRSKIQISSFGKLKAGSRCTKKSTKNVGHSLPFELEHYDDDVWLSKKYAVKATATAPNTPDGDSVKSWLNAVQSVQQNSTQDIVNDDFDMEDATDVSESASSFEMIQPTKETDFKNILKCSAVSEDFLESLHRPMCDWIQRVSSSAKQLGEQKVASPDSVSSCPGGYQFEDVIRKVQQSDNSKWIVKESSEEECTSSRVLDFVPHTTRSVLPASAKSDIKETAPFDEDSFISNLVSLFGRSLSAVSDSEQPINFDDVAAWREVLRQMHASKVWLQQ